MTAAVTPHTATVTEGHALTTHQDTTFTNVSLSWMPALASNTELLVMKGVRQGWYRASPLITQQVGGDNVLVTVAHDSLQWPLGRCLDGLANGGVVGGLH